jgi:hypothetical protein
MDFKGDKIRSTSSFRWEVKLEVPCHKILSNVKDLLKFHREGLTKFSFPLPILLLVPEMSLLKGPPEYWWLLDKLGVRPSRSIIPLSTSQSPRYE